MRLKKIRLVAVVLAGSFASTMSAENWPQWRGPKRDGISSETKVPVKWSKTENVAWRLPLPGQAGSTPIVWGDRIFLTSAAGPDLVLICIDTSGKELWRQKVTQGNRVVRGGEGNSASASPSTDGKHVWSFFGDGTMACHDFEGKEIWKFSFQDRFGKFRIQFGMTSTPLLDGDRIYQQIMTSNGAYVVCLHKETGKDIWKQARTSDAENECEHSYASIQLYRDGQQEMLLSHGADYIVAHRTKDGSEIWRCGGFHQPKNYNGTLRLVASPACGPGIIVVPTAKNGPVIALRPDLTGDVTDSESSRLWKRKDNTPDVPSPLIHDGLVYLCRENGVLICLTSKTGEEVYVNPGYRQRHRASPIYANGNIYLIAADGKANVIKAGRDYQLVASNDLGESVASSPIVSKGTLYVRTYDALYAIRSSAAESDTGK